MLLQYDEQSQTILEDNKHSVQAKVFYFPSGRGDNGRRQLLLR